MGVDYFLAVECLIDGALPVSLWVRRRHVSIALISVERERGGEPERWRKAAESSEATTRTVFEYRTAFCACEGSASCRRLRDARRRRN